MDLLLWALFAKKAAGQRGHIHQRGLRLSSSRSFMDHAVGIWLKTPRVIKSRCSWLLVKTEASVMTSWTDAETARGAVETARRHGLQDECDAQQQKE